MKNLILVLSFFLSMQVFSQTKTVTGVVVDTNGEPVIGATIAESSTTNGTVSDIDGKFTINLLDAKNSLKIQLIGYRPQTISVGERSHLNIVLEEDSKILDEIVVTAYGGKQLRSKVTNSIASVKEDVLETGLHANPAQALSGAVSGLRVQQTSGDPGAVPTIVLRGGTNMDGTGSPLIVVDGQIRNSMADINPNDIQSMEVMKDAGATAIYGARANNGVILITTKRGKEGKTNINFKARVGMNFFWDNYKFLDAGQYLYYMRTAYQRAGQIYQNSKGEWKGTANMATLSGVQPYGTGNLYFDPVTGAVLDGNKDSRAVWSTMKYTDELAFLLDKGWETMTDPVYGDKLIYKNFALKDTNVDDLAISQDYNLSFSGGNDKGNYYANIGYNHSKGNAVGNYYKRLNFSFNADYKLREWLTSQSSFTFSDSKKYGIYGEDVKNEVAINNYFGRVLSVPTTFRGKNEDGDWLIGVRGLSDSNKLINLHNLLRDNNTNKFNINQAFVIKFYKDLSLRVNATWFFDENKREAFNKDLITGVNTVNTKRLSYAYFDRVLDQTYNAVFNYNSQFNGVHNVSALAGFEYYDSYQKGFDAQGYGAPTDDFMDLELTSKDEGARSIDSWHNRQRIMSFFGQANYDYKGKYLLSAVLRRDGYSKLIDNRWGVFPGVSAGWVFSEENFMSDIKKTLSFAKFRASYGVNGNVSGVGYYDLQGRYSSNNNQTGGNYMNYAYGGNVGILLVDLANANLRWEKSHTFDAGLDFGFLNNRIILNTSYYLRRTKDKFASITLPSHSGFSSFRTNNGEIENQGLEFDINAYIIDTKELRWNVSVNGAYNRNKIISLPENGLQNNMQDAFEVYTGNSNDPYQKKWVGGYQEGQSYGDVYAYKAVGIYRDESEIPGNLVDRSIGNNGSDNKYLYGPEAWSKMSDAEKASGLPIQAGDVKWLDVNDDGVIDQYDKVKVGNRVPKFTGGFNTQVVWKGFALGVRLDYALGFVVVDYRTPWILGNMQGTYNTIDLVHDTWSSENIRAKYPTYVWADQMGKRNYGRESSMFIYKGDYLAFREINLAYQVPSKFLNKFGINSLEISATAQNLGYLTAAKNMFSPEYGADGFGGYSLPRSLVFGVNVNF